MTLAEKPPQPLRISAAEQQQYDGHPCKMHTSMRVFCRPGTVRPMRWRGNWPVEQPLRGNWRLEESLAEESLAVLLSGISEVGPSFSCFSSSSLLHRSLSHPSSLLLFPRCSLRLVSGYIYYYIYIFCIILNFLSSLPTSEYLLASYTTLTSRWPQLETSSPECLLKVL